jgi:hypothetical protein
MASRGGPDLKKKDHKATQNRIMEVIKKALKDAVRLGILVKNPADNYLCSKIKKPAQLTNFGIVIRYSISNYES